MESLFLFRSLSELLLCKNCLQNMFRCSGVRGLGDWGIQGLGEFRVSGILLFWYFGILVFCYFGGEVVFHFFCCGCCGGCCYIIGLRDALHLKKVVI